MRSKNIFTILLMVTVLTLAILMSSASAESPVRPADWASPSQSALRGTIPGRPVKVRLEGTISTEDLTIPGTWAIDVVASSEDIPFDVNGDTRIIETLGEAELGARVWVLAQVRPDDDPNLLALIVMVREPRPEQGEPVHFSGEIKSLPGLPGEGPEGTWHENLEGTWTVGGHNFLVTDRTIILPEGVAPDVGDWARVTAFRQPDESLWAKKVTVIKTGIPEIAVTFTGIIEVYPEDSEDPDHPYIGDWVISNITVTCAISTQVIGTPGVGLLAKVKAVRQSNGDLIATKIQIRNAPPITVRFRGIIDSFPPDPFYPGAWKIGEVEVFADDDTEIKGTPEKGLMASGEGIPQTNGTVLAAVITVEEEPPGPVAIEFDGSIVRLPKHWQHGVWIVSDEEGVQRHVLVSSRTQLPPEKPDVETNVHVVGTLTGGVVHASEIVVP